ncbi:sensor domain-containing protein [Zooshikella harenae]|uniref:EAL domain-containing protein n=1 Tax=Zooshikella harenae TaxID=2827238 RepID=A0ABS5ZDG2_9GAMM|nr:EAL domain-containing protein [Zooshikella harenae]MBU2711798.1 EAL domain-containing protein [Zooshikella harenae]
MTKSLYSTTDTTYTTLAKTYDLNYVKPFLPYLLTATDEGVLVIDVKGEILFSNHRAKKILGWRENCQLIQQYWRKLPQTEEAFSTFVLHHAHQSPSQFELTVADNEGGKRIISLQFAQQQTFFLVMLKDLTEQKQSAELLHDLSQYDCLTRLANRSSFQECLHKAVVRGQHWQRKLALLLIDLDRFKNINDTLGHSIGDELLQQVATRLKQCVRRGDAVARLGGDEFAIILENIYDQNDAALVADKIISGLAQPFELQGRQLFVSASIGITVMDSIHADTETMIKQADIAMYRVKDEGKNHYQFYDSNMSALAEYRIHLETSLYRALHEHQLLLHYQPQVDVQTGDIIGLEALIRWQHPHEGIIGPNTFIPLLEETGLILPVGEWALYSACAQRQQWYQQRNLPPYTSISVNLSVRQLLSGNIVNTVKKVLNATGLAPQLLDLEITESMLMGDIKFAIKELGHLKQLGVSISMDDFGTGYSSLSYLKKLPIDTVKIDRSFIEDLPNDVDAASIARAIVGLAHNLGLNVIAEGVENERALAFLKSLGCDYCQGYLFSPPMAADELLTKFSKIKHQAFIESSLSTLHQYHQPFLQHT